MVCQRPRAHGDWRNPYGDWRKDPEGHRDWRKPYGDWRKPDGYAREQGTMESAAVGCGQPDPGPVLGPVSWCAAVQVGWCASVPVCRRSRWCTNMLVCKCFRRFRYDFPSIVLYVCYHYLMISYGFLVNSYCLSMVSCVFLSVSRDVRMVFLWISLGLLMIPDGFPRVVRYVFMISHDSSMIFLEFSNFPMMVLWFSYDLHNFSIIPLCILWFCYRVAMPSFEYDMIWLQCSYDFRFVFLTVPLLFLWSSCGSPMVFIWFC